MFQDFGWRVWCFLCVWGESSACWLSLHQPRPIGEIFAIPPVTGPSTFVLIGFSIGVVAAAAYFCARFASFHGQDWLDMAQTMYESMYARSEGQRLMAAAHKRPLSRSVRLQLKKQSSLNSVDWKQTGVCLPEDSVEKWNSLPGFRDYC